MSTVTAAPKRKSVLVRKSKRVSQRSSASESDARRSSESSTTKKARLTNNNTRTSGSPPEDPASDSSFDLDLTKSPLEEVNEVEVNHKEVDVRDSAAEVVPRGHARKFDDDITTNSISRLSTGSDCAAGLVPALNFSNLTGDIEGQETNTKAKPKKRLSKRVVKSRKSGLESAEGVNTVAAVSDSDVIVNDNDVTVDKKVLEKISHHEDPADTLEFPPNSNAGAVTPRTIKPVKPSPSPVPRPSWNSDAVRSEGYLSTFSPSPLDKKKTQRKFPNGVESITNLPLTSGSNSSNTSNNTVPISAKSLSPMRSGAIERLQKAKASFLQEAIQLPREPRSPITSVHRVLEPLQMRSAVKCPLASLSSTSSGNNFNENLASKPALSGSLLEQTEVPLTSLWDSKVDCTLNGNLPMGMHGDGPTAVLTPSKSDRRHSPPSYALRHQNTIIGNILLAEEGSAELEAKEIEDKIDHNATVDSTTSLSPRVSDSKLTNKEIDKVLDILLHSPDVAANLREVEKKDLKLKRSGDRTEAIYLTGSNSSSTSPFKSFKVPQEVEIAKNASRRGPLVGTKLQSLPIKHDIKRDGWTEAPLYKEDVLDFSPMRRQKTGEFINEGGFEMQAGIGISKLANRFKPGELELPVYLREYTKEKRILEISALNKEAAQENLGHLAHHFKNTRSRNHIIAMLKKESSKRSEKRAVARSLSPFMVGKVKSLKTRASRILSRQATGNLEGTDVGSDSEEESSLTVHNFNNRG